MERKIVILVDYDGTLVSTVRFYILNPGILLKNLVSSMANFLRYAIKNRNLDPLILTYYFLLEEDKRRNEIISGIRKRLPLYVANINLIDLLKKLSENGYDITIVSSSSQEIIRGVLGELEKIYGKKIKVNVIASSQDGLVTSKTKGDIAESYSGPKICFTDGGPNDIEFSNSCNVTIIKPSILYYLFPEKPEGYIAKGKNFEEVLKILEEKLISSNFN